MKSWLLLILIHDVLSLFLNCDEWFFVFWLFLFCFVLFRFVLERERESASKQREQTERLLSRFHTQHRAQCGAQSHNPGIMTWAKIKSQTLNLLSHPGAPVMNAFFQSLHRIGSSSVHWSGYRCSKFKEGGRREDGGVGGRWAHCASCWSLKFHLHLPK